MTGRIWTGSFWRATAERMVRGFSSATLAAGVAGATNAAEVPWQGALLAGALGAVVELLVSLSANSATGDGPGVTSAETVRE